MQEGEMADDKQSFSELLKEAPLASDTETVTAFGALARTPDSGKFVLIMANGSVTLEVDAVKSFRRVGAAIGQILVELQLDAKKLPRELEIMRGDGSTFGAGGVTLAVVDLPSGGPEKHALTETIEERAGGGFPGGGSIGGGATPYALATPHHAPAQTVEALQAMLRLGSGQTPFWQDVAWTGLWADWKLPAADGTTPGRLTSDV
jgi:hypothetical protein